MFAKLRQAIPRTPQQEPHCQAWISSETWSLINTRIEACRRKDQRISWSLSRAIKAGIQEDRRRRAAESGSVAESLFASNPPLNREAWIQMWGWYKDAVDHPPPPSIVALATMTAKREELYLHAPPLGEPIPLEDLPFLVDYDIPEDEEIPWEVRRLGLNLSGSPSVIRAEYLRQWLITATQDDSPDVTNFLNCVAIVKAAFREGTLAE